MSAWRGDLRELGNLEANLRRLAEVPSRAASAVADDLAQLVEDQFDAGVDPYGTAWEDLMQSTIDRGRSPPPLTDTSEMRDTLEVRPMGGAGVSITFDAEYAGFHQHGTRNMAKRAILPDEEVPDTWERAIQDAVDAAADDIMGGR